MRRVAVAWAIAACGTPARTPIADPPPVIAKAPSRGPVHHAGTLAKKIEAPHGGAIVRLAATPDGGAAVTCDELGGVRLWPALDGSAEPRVVELPSPEELALGRDPRGFVIAMLDSVGGLVIQLVDRDGLAIRRAVLPPEPGFRGLAMTARGTLAWREDQRLIRLTADGTVDGELAAEPGQRIVAVAAAGDRALAVLEIAGRGKPTHRGRWLTLGPALAWGAWLGGAAELGPVVALSPSGGRVATVVERRLRVYDTRRGSSVADEVGTGIAALGMATEDQLALAAPSGTVVWLDLATSQHPVMPAESGSSTDPGPLAVAGGRAIGAQNGELVLGTPSGTSYLGYELESPAVAAAAPGGKLLIGLGDVFVQLDRELRESAAPDLGVPAGSAIADLRWLGGSQWLVESSRVDDGVTAVAVVDTASRRSTPVRRGMAMVHQLGFEPSTGLATLSLGDVPEVLRLVAGRLERVAVLGKPTGFERTQLVPVAPVLAKGAQLVAVQMRDRLTIRWLRELAALDRGGSPITVDGSLAAVGPAGHAFVWQGDPKGALELAIYRDGKRTGVLPTDGPTAVWPDPRGDRVVAVAQRSVKLVALDGTAQWAKPLERVTEALWLDDGTIGIVSAAGIARLDPATGDVIAARCGWRFGLTAKPHPMAPRVEPVCTQLR